MTLRRNRLLPVCALIALLAFPAFGHAHSLKAVSWQGTAIIVEAVYGGGDAAAYAEVNILAPGEAVEFQTGVTDGKGRFAFVPDRPGKWRVIIDAGMGHKTALAIDVSEEAIAH